MVALRDEHLECRLHQLGAALAPRHPATAGAGRTRVEAVNAHVLSSSQAIL
jgi:hypothetical protein